MKKFIAFVVATHLLPTQLQASQAQLYAELDEAMNGWQTSQHSVQDNDEFEQFKTQHLNEYHKYVEEHFAEFDAFRDKLIKQWGDAQTSTTSRYVHYSQAENTRLIVDFEQDQLVVGIKHHADTDVSQENAQAVFKRFLQSNSALLTEFFKTQSVKEQQATIEKSESYIIDNKVRAKALLDAKRQIQNQTQQQQQLLEKQFDVLLAGENDVLSPNALTNPQNYNAQQVLEKKKADLQTLQNNRLKNLKESIKELPSGRSDSSVTEFVIKLPKNTLAKQRASSYLNQITAHSKRFDIDGSLVLAVMHTESHFNPLAKSHIPAYGLMQVVPTSAGVDVNRFLYDIDEPMSEPYLYVTNNNIEAGTAYLHILNDRYLRHIEDPISRKYCTIAAYNTGAGNVARVFNSDDSRNIKKASRVINSMSPELVLEALQSRLPYDETKHYLEKVLSREAFYIQ
ncbi:transglycosylase SLT domain-containing protein [Pseudoalteromonas sp. MMG012]|uniref:transglycosylase SLT domain-containing protein n=1 Tax=Pseudoalteromonas sp. MMG012 TaxID=2822686 RepID=UPI001B3A6461|nr:transglycosylase SLT domain-containing protein [Pseudoalteromonas sp. MMG012]MBQ4851332.1 transglycosylase SLT domain-containing protein [Pseudoalteromonas sp. MMG012]